MFFIKKYLRVPKKWRHGTRHTAHGMNKRCENPTYTSSHPLSHDTTIYKKERKKEKERKERRNKVLLIAEQNDSSLYILVTIVTRYIHLY